MRGRVGVGRLGATARAFPCACPAPASTTPWLPSAPAPPHFPSSQAPASLWPRPTPASPFSLYSPVAPRTEMGPRRCPPWIPYSRNLYFLPGSRPSMVTSRWSLATGTAWGCPAGSLYWTTKESKGPWATVHERRRESGVSSVTISSPRRGGRCCSFSRGAVERAGGETLCQELPLSQP